MKRLCYDSLKSFLRGCMHAHIHTHRQDFGHHGNHHALPTVPSPSLPPSISSPLSLPPLLGSKRRGGLLLPSCFAGWSRKKPEAVNEQHSGQRYIEKQSDGGCSGISQGGMADVASCLYSSCSFSLGEFSLILIENERNYIQNSWCDKTNVLTDGHCWWI